jgi:hypothetical protein
MKTKLALVSVATFLLTACGGSTDSATTEGTNDVAVVIQNPQDPANASYYIDGILYTLVNGSLDQPIDDSETVNKFRLQEFKAAGDINEDGVDDTAVVLINDAGGSGTFYYLGILTSGSTPIVENTTFLGDRLVVKSINFVGKNFEVTYLDRDSETSFDQPATIEITGIAELDATKTGFMFTCRDNAGICL